MSDSATLGQAGFSLIETMVALMLLLVGLTAVTTGFVEGQRLAAEVGQRQRAISLAQDKLVEQLARPYDAATVPTLGAERVANGVMIGADEVNGISRTWAVETDYPAPGLARVWVATRWAKGGMVHTYEIAGLLAESLSP